MILTAQSEIQADGQGGYYEVTKDGQATKLQEASISLNDCLACRLALMVFFTANVS